MAAGKVLQGLFEINCANVLGQEYLVSKREVLEICELISLADRGGGGWRVPCATWEKISSFPGSFRKKLVK